MADNQDIIIVNNLKKYFPIKTDLLGRPLEQVKAVNDVSFTIKKGTTLGVVGESGCGKTTMGRTILRLIEITGGEVIYKGLSIEKFSTKQLAKLAGQDAKPGASRDDLLKVVEDKGVNIALLSKSELRKIRPEIQIIFQDPYSSLSPRLTVSEIIGEAVKAHKLVPKDQYRDYIIKIMKDCGLQEHYFDRYPHEFSGGQRQRICIARALALNPKIVVCDEPVSALDVSIQAQIINLLKDLQDKYGLTYIFISHDLSVVEHISDEVAVMYLGCLMEKGSKERIFANPMHPYTEALLSAVPVPDPNVKMNRIVLSGDIPSPANPPSGCKFHTRCRKCMKVCSEKEPVLREYEPGHFVACHLYDPDMPKEPVQNG